MSIPTMQYGTWLSIGSPAVAELAGLCGFDWVLFDLEHGCESEAAIPNQLRGLRGSSTRGVVRVGAPHSDQIARLLDWGANGIMVPHVNTSAEAEAIVQAATYAPRGHRGVSRTVRAFDYGLNLPADNDRPKPLIFTQIETSQAVQNASEIAGVDGVDVLFVGPADLRFDLRNQSKQDDYLVSLETVIAAAREVGKAAGILLLDPAEYAEHRDLGFTYIAVHSDIAILRKAYQQTFADVFQVSRP